MDPRLLHYYNQELQYLRELGGEFAEEFPKVAARLGMNGLEVADPYVERLLEGVGFLAARVQLKLDAELPRFTQSLIEIVYPDYLAPTPAMLIAQIKPELTDSNLAAGVTVPRGTSLQGLLGKDDLTACEFRTAQDVTLYPLELVSASYFSYAPDLPLTSLPFGARVKGGVRLRLRATAGLAFNELSLDRLCFYLGGREDIANALYELILGAGLGALVVPPERPAEWLEVLPASGIGRVGFTDEEALLPVTHRSFQGYRLLREYLAFPQRFRFFELTGLQRAFKRATTHELDIILLFGRGEATLESLVDAGNFTLFATPAINLFPKRLDRIHITDGAFEYHVVPDRTRPLDFEVYALTEVIGHGAESDSERVFRPFYAAYGADIDRHSAFHTVRRELRLVTSAQRRRGWRSSYVGTEVFVSLVDAEQAPFSSDLRQLSLQALCTNRDLPLQLPIGLGSTDFTLDIAAPVTEIRALGRPSAPCSPVADGIQAWRAISHLSLNYLSMMDVTQTTGAAALRDILELYAPVGDVTAKRQIEAVRSVRVQPIIRRLPGAGVLSFGRGLEIAIEVDELAYEGASVFLFGAVLQQFLARQASINSFVEVALRSVSRGEIHRWGPAWGKRPIL
ncbi:MAG: type VI secretion system baseplate subunit TssF [Gammaproteobacteria bacterium]|nr:type VI secretion system baseplate subunit TssF [Gammaproteobacteria bacterium]